MITLYPYEELGTAEFGWLKPRYHFTFSRYYNPSRLAFGHLRVINDDIIAAKSGFPDHDHQNMEIITYVKKGAISHKDNTGASGVTKAGSVQVMSAGTGVTHSEYNHEDETCELYQIWIMPSKNNVAPRWEMRDFPHVPRNDGLTCLVSGREEDKPHDPAFIYQDAAIFGGKLLAGAEITHPVKYQAYILCAAGDLTINNATALKKGDGAEAENFKELTFKTDNGAEILVIDVPPLE